MLVDVGSEQMLVAVDAGDRTSEVPESAAVVVVGDGLATVDVGSRALVVEVSEDA